MSEITRNQAIQIVEDIRTAISAGSVTNTMEAQVLEYCVSVLGRRIVEASLSGNIENLPDVAEFLAGISPSTTLKALLEGITDAVEVINANIGNGYVYAGIATPSGTPVSGKVFYLAKQAGQYANFGGLTVTEGINILKRNGSAWTQEQLVSMADIRKNPLIGYYECDTAGDTAAKAVTAAGYVLPATGGSVKIKMANRNTVANATLNINSTGAKPLYYNGQRAGVGNTWDTNEIIEVFYDGAKYQAYNVAGSNGDGVFDISAYNLTDGQPTPYEDLAAALGPNGDNIPLSLRKRGMSIKFVQSDNTYVQYRLMAQNFTTDVTKWALMEGNVYVENQLYLEIKTDKDGKVLEGIKKDGTKILGGGVKVRGKAELPFGADVCNVKYYKIDNPEWEWIITDADGRISAGQKKSGKIYIANIRNPQIEKNTSEIESLKNNINEIEDNVGELEDIVLKGSPTLDIISQNPSNEILPKLQNVVFPLHEIGSANITRKNLSLLHFSDIHNYVRNMVNIKEFYDKFSAFIDDVIHTGDTEGNNLSTDISDKWGVSWLNCIGNHDAVLGTAGNYVIQPSTESYNKIFKPYIANWSVNQPLNAEQNGYCYYYKDYNDEKVRLIVIDNFVQRDSEYNHWNNTQKQWFIDTLKETLNSNSTAYGYHVIVGVHYPPFLVTKDKTNTFQSIERTNTYTCIAEIPDIIEEFITGTGNFSETGAGVFICWLSGHTHYDYNGFGADYPNQFTITISGSLKPDQVVRYDESDRVAGTMTEYCFNILGIDTYNKMIRVLRIGTTTDRYLRGKHSFAYDYENKQIISIN